MALKMIFSAIAIALRGHLFFCVLFKKDCLPERLYFSVQLFNVENRAIILSPIPTIPSFANRWHCVLNMLCAAFCECRW